jgi:hypothetical protein
MSSAINLVANAVRSSAGRQSNILSTSTGGGSGGGRMTGVVSSEGVTMGTVATACTVCCNFPSQGSTADLSANETEGARVHDLIEVTTGDDSPVGAEREQTVAGRTDEAMASIGI